ncbi:MAG: 3TM-type holin [Gemmatimonadota bacterium]
MNVLSKILGSPVKDVIEAVGSVIDKLSTTDQEKLEAKQKLIEAQQRFELRMVELDTEFASLQAKVIEAEAKSESWLAANWRPILMLTFTYIVAHNFVFAPLFSLKALAIPGEMWELLKIGVGGYVMGRTVERVQ